MSIRILRMVSLALTAWLSAGSVSAQTTEASSALELGDVTVTATRVEKPIDRIPAAVGVVEQDAIQLGTQQLGLDESLVSVPGLFLQNRYNFAQDLRIAIRGFGARASFGIRGIKILVDDIPETLPDGQGNVDSIDLGSAERVEVIRGPASALYGNASGGVILITTESGPPEPFVQPGFTVGDYDFSRLSFKAGGESGDFNYLVNASSLELDGYRDHSRTEIDQLNGKVRYTIDPTSDFLTSFNVTDSPIADDPGAITLAQADDDPTQARDANVQFDAGEEVQQQRLGFVYRKDFGKMHELKVRNHYVWRDFQNNLPFTDGGSVDLDRSVIGGGALYAFSGQLGGKQNRLSLGVDVDSQSDDRKRFDNLDGVRGNLVFDQVEDVSATGVFIQNEHRFTRDVELTVGARHDRVRFEVDDDFLADGDDSGSRTLEESSGLIGVLYSLSPSANLYANVSTSFETPTTTEFANPDGSGGFNPDLDPQTATNYEIGIKGRLPRRTRYELAVFSIDVEDELIPFEVAGQPGREFFANAGRSTHDGIEAALSTELGEGLRLSLAYTYSDFSFDDFTDDGNVFDGNEIPGIPENLLHAELAWYGVSGIYAIGDALYVGSFFLDNANSVKSDAYTVANLRAGYTRRYSKWEFAFFAGVNNLFDESYNANLRVNAFGGRFYEPAPERNYYAGATARYDFTR